MYVHYCVFVVSRLLCVFKKISNNDSVTSTNYSSGKNIEKGKKHNLLNPKAQVNYRHQQHTHTDPESIYLVVPVKYCNVYTQLWDQSAYLPLTQFSESLSLLR